MLAKYFMVQEFIPDYIYNVLGDRSINLIDQRQIITADQLRALFGEAYINTWYFGHKSKYKGWRPYNCIVGAKKSTHKIGMGTDITFTKYHPLEIQAYIVSKPKLFPNITAIEKIKTHLHYSCYPYNHNGLKIIIP